MAPATLAPWLQSNRRNRRRLLAILAGTLAIQAFLVANQRAIFVPWAEAREAALPSAFFARVDPPVIRRGFGPSGRSGQSGFTPGQRSDPGSAGSRVPFAADEGFRPTGPLEPFVPDPQFSSVSLPGGGPGRTAGPIGSGGGPVGSSPVGPIGPVVGPLPETSTWIMMLLGFGLVGHALRSRPLRKPSIKLEAITVDRD